ncbi:MAG: FliH/SctL family protein [Mariniblastus sp.]
MNTHILKFDRPLSNACAGSRSVGQKVTSSAAKTNSNANSEVNPESNSQSRSAPVPQPTIAENTTPDPHRVEKLLEQIAASVANFGIQSDSLVKETRTFAIKLASSMVQSVFGNSHEAKIQRLERLLGEAMKTPEQVLKVLLTAEDKAALESSGVLESLPFEIKCDPSVGAGECRIEFSTHELVSDLETQLKGIERSLLDVADEF